jgi:hypothetical protein
MAPHQFELGHYKFRFSWSASLLIYIKKNQSLEVAQFGALTSPFGTSLRSRHRNILVAIGVTADKGPHGR